MTKLIHREFTVDVPLQAAWDHLARIEDWPRWARHIRGVRLEPAGRLTANSVGVFKLKPALRSAFRMSEFNPHRNWKWVGRFLWLTVHYDHQFEPLGTKRTRLRWTVEATGLGSSVLGRLFARIYNRNLDRAIPLLIDEMRGTYGSPQTSEHPAHG